MAAPGCSPQIIHFPAGLLPLLLVILNPSRTFGAVKAQKSAVMGGKYNKKWVTGLGFFELGIIWPQIKVADAKLSRMRINVKKVRSVLTKTRWLWCRTLWHCPGLLGKIQHFLSASWLHSSVRARTNNSAPTGGKLI